MTYKTIRIKLKSYDHILIDKSSERIVGALKQAGIGVRGPIPLPTKRSVYTVLRSPHVDKKSREQFEVKVHKRLIDVMHSEDTKSKIMDALTRLEISAGVHVEIKGS